MDDIFRLRGRSYGFFGFGDMVSIAETRLCENAAADGYEVRRRVGNSPEWSYDQADTSAQDTVREIAAVVEERLRESAGDVYAGSRIFYYLGSLYSRLPPEEYDELLRIARLSSRSGVCIGVHLASGEGKDWSGIPLYKGRIGGGMMVWERINPGELP